MNDTPALPPLTGDHALEVFTHTSLRNTSSSPDKAEYDDAGRFVELGHIALSMAIMHALFQQKPVIPPSGLSAKHKELMGDSQIKQWLDCYQLKSKVRISEDQRHKLDTPTEERRLLHTYVGAVYVQDGLQTLVPWISCLINPGSEPLAALGKKPDAAPQPHSKRPAQDSILASFNQKCAKQHIGIKWDTEPEGPSHNLRWTAKCYVNDKLQGTGIGSNTKTAKEEAARQAIQAMGW